MIQNTNEVISILYQMIQITNLPRNFPAEYQSPPSFQKVGCSIGYTKVITCHKGSVFIDNLTNE